MKYKSFFSEDKTKSMIKGAIGAEFDKNFNDHPKLPIIPELLPKQIGKSFSIKENETLDTEQKDGEKRKLLGSVHPEVLDPEEMKIDHVEISYAHSHDSTEYDATDKRFDGKLSEELVDDTHSTVKRAINADFTMGDQNKDKGDPKVDKDKKKSKKNEATYKSQFNEETNETPEIVLKISDLFNYIEAYDFSSFDERYQQDLERNCIELSELLKNIAKYGTNF